jgi:hypothetical protein
MENQTPANEDSLHALSFAVKRSSRYHAKRAAFFAKLNQLNSLATILLASAPTITSHGHQSEPSLKAWL